jgi:hypothetical protein
LAISGIEDCFRETLYINIFTSDISAISAIDHIEGCFNKVSNDIFTSDASAMSRLVLSKSWRRIWNGHTCLTRPQTHQGTENLFYTPATMPPSVDRIGKRSRTGGRLAVDTPTSSTGIVPSDAGSTTSSKRAKFGSQLAVDTPASSVIGTDMEVSFPYTGEASDDEDMPRRPSYHRTATQSTSKGFVEEDSETPTRQLGTKTLQLKNNRLDKQDAKTVQRKNNLLNKQAADASRFIADSFDENEPENLDEDTAILPYIKLKLAIHGLAYASLYKMHVSESATTVDDIDIY